MEWSWPAEYITPDVFLRFSLSISLATLICLVLRPVESDNRTCCEMVPEHVYEMCHNERTVTSELARDPTQSPENVFHHLYRGKRGSRKGGGKPDKLAADDALQRAYECGRWGPRKPSDLFLKVSQEPGIS